MNKFTIIPGDNFIWNKFDLLAFLIANQEKDIVLSLNAEGCCLSSIGLYKLLDLFKFKSVRLLTPNLVEAHESYSIVQDSTRFRFFDFKHFEYSSYQNWNGNTIFGAIFNRPLWYRIGLVSHLYINHKDKTTINFRADPHNEDNRRLFELQKLFDIHPESIENFMQSYKHFPKKIKEIDYEKPWETITDHTDALLPVYSNFLIDIVAETFTSGRTFFITEKTIRPILLKKPFIVMGPKCFLIHLRQMGFRTFNDFWSEDYDGYAPADRYKMILTLIDDLSKKSVNELAEMYHDMQQILDHNYNLLKTKAFTHNITYVE